jgi:hypothetical protein
MVEKESLNNQAVTDVSKEPAVSIFKAEWIGQMKQSWAALPLHGGYYTKYVYVATVVFWNVTKCRYMNGYQRLRSKLPL